MVWPCLYRYIWQLGYCAFYPRNGDMKTEPRRSASPRALFAILLAIAGASCADDPSSIAGSPDPCNNMCLAGFEECNAMSGECEPLGSSADVYEPDAGSASTDLADTSSSRRDGDDRLDARPDRPGEDGRGHDVQHSDMGTDLADLVESDGAGIDTGRPDIGRGDTGQDIPPSRLCPDWLEAHDVDDAHFGNNDTPDRATRLHDTLVVGQLQGCAVSASCSGPCRLTEDVCSEVSAALCDCCECDAKDDLASCGELGDDPDYYVLSLLLGDHARVRVHVSSGTPRGDLLVEVTDPADGRHLGVYQSNGGAPFFEVALTGGFADLDPGITREYQLRVQSIAPSTTIPYELEVQVDPYSRGCPGDPWDAPWADYSRDGATEASCSDSSCVVSLSTGDEAAPTLAHICPWDHGDFFSHNVPDGTGRTVRVTYDHTATTHMAAVLYRESGSDLEEIGEVCPESERATSDCDDSPGVIEWGFDGLVAGDYQLEVRSDDPAPNQISVFFFE